LDSDDEFYIRPTPNDSGENAHSTNSADNAYSSAEQRDSKVTDCESTRDDEQLLLSQATAASEDKRVVLCAPEIKIDFDNEPTIELASYY